MNKEQLEKGDTIFGKIEALKQLKAEISKQYKDDSSRSFYLNSRDGRDKEDKYWYALSLSEDTPVLKEIPELVECVKESCEAAVDRIVSKIDKQIKKLEKEFEAI